jgi:hypothetical protein
VIDLISTAGEPGATRMGLVVAGDRHVRYV